MIIQNQQLSCEFNKWSQLDLIIQGNYGTEKLDQKKIYQEVPKKNFRRKRIIKDEILQY